MLLGSMDTANRSGESLVVSLVYDIVNEELAYYQYYTGSSASLLKTLQGFIDLAGFWSLQLFGDGPSWPGPPRTDDDREVM